VGEERGRVGGREDERILVIVLAADEDVGAAAALCR
jgi:hypothetical protein